jgi:ABC-type methionine transport system ATPase subunit
MIFPNIFVDQNLLNEKSVEELEKSVSDLHNKLNFAYRTNNRALINQLLSTIESYKSVLHSKIQDTMNKKNINTVVDIKKY